MSRPFGERKAICRAVSCILTQLCLKYSEEDGEKRKTRFHAAEMPLISIEDYIERIALYSSCSESCFILALVYIDRIIHVNEDFELCFLNIHRLLITSVLLAAKFHDDDSLGNSFFAEVGGISCLEMNVLEIEFLYLLNFTLRVSSTDFQRYKEELKNHGKYSLCCGKLSKKA
mmetsp:Transcript_7934/g.11960  ORF Transcript_7934/g.11960 Transcript_7934/m.11960 type:complete len:173 (+) Transcript_7934:52-570(+)